MKTLQIFIVVLFPVWCFSVTREMVDKMSAVNEKCLEESKVDRALAFSSKWRGAGNDTKFMNYMLCFNVKIGYIDENGQFNKQIMASYLPDFVNNKEDIVNKCAVQKQTLEETAYEAMKCIDDHLPRGRPRY